MEQEGKNSAFRDHTVFPEVTTSDGEVLTPEQVAFAYTREGRRIVGKEYPNPVPLEPPIGYVASKPLHEQIREMVMREMGEAADGEETFEEADDFDVGDDLDPSTPYEAYFEPVNPWPASEEVAALEREIAEHRALIRAPQLRDELAVLRGEKPAPEPKPPSEEPPKPTKPSGKKKSDDDPT